jgi:hypothetical protein
MALIGDPDWEPEFSLAEGPERAREYVVKVRPDLEGGDLEVTYLDAGVMNYVYRVSGHGDRSVFYLKQALAKVKQHKRLGADLAGVSPARIKAEWTALVWLGGSLPKHHRHRVPLTAWLDGNSNILWTREILPGGVSLHDELLSGRCDVEQAKRVGGLLGAVHAAVGEEIPKIWPTEAEDQGNWERFLRMRTFGFTDRARLSPEAQAIVDQLVAEGRANVRTGMISHLDAAPKNWLLRDDGEFALLDFELGAARSDPAYDPGFLAGHYLLMGQNRPEMAEGSVRAVEAMMARYLEEGPEVDRGWAARVHRYAALTMLYRLHGSSPASYLEPSRFDVIRSEAIARLMRGS